jgi:hypothetical protein
MLGFITHIDYGNSNYDARQRPVFHYYYEIPSVRHFDAFFDGFPAALRMAGTSADEQRCSQDAARLSLPPSPWRSPLSEVRFSLIPASSLRGSLHTGPSTPHGKIQNPRGFHECTLLHCAQNLPQSIRQGQH